MRRCTAIQLGFMLVDPLKPTIVRFPLGPLRVDADHRIFKVCSQQLDHSRADSRRVTTLACNDWCNVVALTTNGELVLVHQHRFGTDTITLEIPGGVIDDGEEPLAAAKRELLEETGYTSDEWIPLSMCHPNPAIQGNRCFAFLARGAQKTSGTHFDENEECEVVLVPQSQTRTLIDEGHITHSLAIVALEKALRERP